VRETFGALLAAWQGKAAGDPKVRAAMRVIARDEARHAELAWHVARWIEGRLSPAARARVHAARRRAVATLARDVEREVAPALVRDAGIPSPHVARALFDAIRDELAA